MGRLFNSLLFLALFFLLSPCVLMAFGIPDTQKNIINPFTGKIDLVISSSAIVSTIANSTLTLTASNTNYIFNQSTLQSGSSFYVGQASATNIFGSTITSVNGFYVTGLGSTQTLIGLTLQDILNTTNTWTAQQTHSNQLSVIASSGVASSVFTVSTGSKRLFDVSGTTLTFGTSVVVAFSSPTTGYSLGVATFTRTDGIVSASCLWPDQASADLRGKVGPANPPTLIIVRGNAYEASGTAHGQGGGLSMPVRAGSWWMIDVEFNFGSTNPACSIFFTPFGGNP